MIQILQYSWLFDSGSSGVKRNEPNRIPSHHFEKHNWETMTSSYILFLFVFIISNLLVKKTKGILLHNFVFVGTNLKAAFTSH